MHKVRSKDGTAIAYVSSGSGRTVILIGGAFSYRAFPKMVLLADLLATEFAVINYDRRGRGDSGDTFPFAVEREIEDIAALIEAVGGSASLWGWSSGAVLGLRAASAGLDVDRVALYEPPFLVDDSRPPPQADFSDRLDDLLTAERRSKAVVHYMTKAMGVPRPIVAGMRITPFWSRLKAVAHTLPYDWAVMGDTLSGRPLSEAEWGRVDQPTLSISGEKSPAQLRNAARAIAGVLPNGRHHELKGQSHNPSMKALAPVLAEFFAGAAAPQRDERAERPRSRSSSS
jgi:pimeloyl-ACP methyl ester carboxylesterase